MDVRTIIRKCAPSLLRDVYRSIRPVPTWKGVYPHLSEVPATEASRRSHGWRLTAVDPAEYSTLPPEVIQEHAFLAVVAATACHRNGGSLKVLDVGGGLGISYTHLLHSLHDCPDLEYHIVDLEWACQQGGRFFEQDRRIRFHRSLPDVLSNLDVVHLTGTLEYIEDYPGALTTLCAYRAEYFLLAGVHAGSFPTYATAQVNVPGTIFPQWFLNVDEIIGLMKEGGYRLIFKGATYTVIDQRNFPEALRLPGGRPGVLLFALARN